MERPGFSDLRLRGNIAVMKVLGVVILHPLKKTSGATTAAFELSRAISKVIPYTLASMWDEDESSDDNGLKVWRFRSTNPLSALAPLLPRWTYIPLYSSGISDFIEKNRFDVVHIHNVIPTFAMKSVADACIRQGIPYCISTHGFMEIMEYAKINRFGLLKRFLTNISMTRPFLSVVRNAAWIFTLSPHDDGILEKLNYPKARRSIVTNGVKPLYLEPPPDHEVEGMSKKLGITDERPRLLFAGSTHPYKGLDTFLASLRHIPIPVTAIIGGEFKSDSEKNDVLGTTNASDLARHKIMFTGWLTDAELRSLYHIADIFVYPTRGDTLPLCVLEAMACRLPVVSTEIGGIPYQLAGGAGFVANSDNPTDIAQIVSNLIDDVDLRKRMGDAARKRVDAVFNWEKSAAVAIEQYQRIAVLYAKDRC
jgi:alpha-maltose-1-phosphate synthase